MNCPKCGFVQPDGMPDCQRCQVIFAKWQARQTQAAETMALPEAVAPSVLKPTAAPPPVATHVVAANSNPPSPPPNDYLPQYTYIPPVRNLEPEAQKRNWGVLVALLVIAGLVAWGGWAVFTPASKGLPVVDGSYRAPDNAFAIMPPEHWTTADQGGAGQTDEAQSGDAKLKQVVSFVKNSAQKDDLENISVIVSNQQIPHLSHSDKAEVEKLVVDIFANKLPGFEVKLDDSAFINVDKLQALRIVSHVTGTNPMTKMKVSFFIQHVLVSGDGRTILVQCVSTSADNKNCDDSVGSFRVLKRPTLAGGSLLFKGTLKAGLIGAVVGLTVGFIRWLLGGG